MIFLARAKGSSVGISPEAESLLLAHGWPGNVRERRSAVEPSMIVEDIAYIHPSSLPIAVRGSDFNFPEPGELAAPSLTDDAMSLVEQDRRLLVQALEKTGGNQAQAAPFAPHHTRYAALQDEEI